MRMTWMGQGGSDTWQNKKNKTNASLYVCGERDFSLSLCLKKHYPPELDSFTAQNPLRELKYDFTMTPPFRNLWLWIRRFRQRCGYGVHSPFAFGLLENVVYEKLPYYAFRELDAQLTWRQKFRTRRYLHLLFRLVNYQQPVHVLYADAHPLELAYLKAACPRAVLCNIEADDAFKAWQESAKSTDESGEKRLLFLGAPYEDVAKICSAGTMLLLANVHEHKGWWESLPAVVSFDLYDVGIALFDPHYQPQRYVVNF